MIDRLYMHQLLPLQFQVVDDTLYSFIQEMQALSDTHPDEPIEKLFDGDRDDVEQRVDAAASKYKEHEIEEPAKIMLHSLDFIYNYQCMFLTVKKSLCDI